MAAEGTLFDRIGGESALNAAVNLFYEKLLKAPTLAIFFEGVDVGKLKRHQYKFMHMAFSNSIPVGTDVAEVMARGHRCAFGRPVLIDLAVSRDH
jgi:hemoglobin